MVGIIDTLYLKTCYAYPKAKGSPYIYVTLLYYQLCAYKANSKKLKSFRVN